MPNDISIRTLLPMACDGVGPSMTCLNIHQGMHAAGYDTELFAIRRRIRMPDIRAVFALPRVLSHLPYSTVRSRAAARIERLFLEAIVPENIAFLWPTASLDMHRALHELGIPIVLEGINTRMLTAKQILDTAYADMGLPPSHGITEERIAEEEAKYDLATAIFAPNAEVEHALAGTPLETGILPTSYGVHLRHASPPRTYREGEDMVFMFCGYASVRKGIHFILDA